MIRIIAASLAMLIAGCTTQGSLTQTPSAPQIPQQQPVMHPAPAVILSQPPAAAGESQTIEVTSTPAGAKITLNDKPVGVTPGKFSIIRKANRHGFLPRMTITAEPAVPSKNIYAQTRIYDGYTETPAKIEFDMSKPPPLPMIDGE